MVLFDGPEMPGKVNAAAANGIVGSELLGAGQLLIAGMRRMTGSGDPDRGDDFGQAAVQFDGAEQTVTAAAPDDSWQGGAARAYAEKNHRQADRTASMAVLDRGVHTVLAREAQQISLRRENLDSQANHLAHMRRTTESIALVPGVGQALHAAFALAAVNAALSTSAAELCQLTGEVGENAAALHQIAEEYAVIAAETATPTESEAQASDRPVRLDAGDSPAVPRPPQIMTRRSTDAV